MGGSFPFPFRAPGQVPARSAAEKRSALLTLDYLRAEAAEGPREEFEAFLAAVPDVEPVEPDRVE